ncbi:Acyl transferase OS=Tsukamurella paurometabola (strain ATCC 8368 / DSM / CCUG 35730 / CIP 100753/ JCM 10117 / KCTC 9821 / NBRC 16120 / NCIMB 702349 / NCTC 13040) OX=521096 GN=Tpau_3478 PE=4 SV=1 [Tsukamurella paurometabola]|uniref:Acyl transferase n=1 Tax=Tsukamurella paurometabola (strain ATCC 8368 / DSM 20162 / CCUG 35730 / CIP 100753 / JCM 10117 / KCTC 9821 / NBRC 16120 / NCIMB 702349 / NCTC 13040) TaxID=521096 RepID=D5UX40_TSUPD|nr:type I polyketide synthase [Tsukamurella paurometabola]ADG80059.1 Acyl transferase [Tsukamurella paurometabola DSM 20162]SUP38245.1 Erythronolide synthase, modules 3 and 4 [Tsukamurella paurometabola]
MSEQEAKLRDYLKRTLAELRVVRRELAEATAGGGDGRRSESGDPIAIVGIGIRFPGIHGPAQMWSALERGADLVGSFPTDRGWDLAGLYRPPAGDDPRSGEREPGTSYVDAGSFLSDVAEFDAEFFGISPREALAMDPQQRLLLHTGWEAIEHARIDPTSLAGERVGVYLGATDHDYARDRATWPTDIEGNAMIGRSGAASAGRISYTLGLTGPAITVDTMCSSSLVATHLAVRALRQGECTMALVAGTTVMSTPEGFTEFSAQGALSPSGRCRSFSDDADGTAWSEGIAAVVLQPLSEAQRDGRRVLAVIEGSAVNQDGASNGLTAPSVSAQRDVITAALRDAGLDPADIDAVEAHGTGTVLGDPIEATALLQTYGAAPARRRPLLLGSFKSNVGHSAAAAGVAGLIKMTLALTHGSLPRTLHVDAPSTKVDWSQGAVELLTAPRPWSATPGRRRRAGISAFGASGTNAHVIVADAPPVPEPTGPDPEILSSTGVGRGALAWPLSARSAAALPAQAQALLTEVDSAFAADHPDDDVARERYCADLALSLAGRTQHPHRVVITGGPARLRERLAGLARSEAVPEPGVVAVDTARDRLGPVFVFPGQGGQWAGMAAGLLRDCPAFAHRWEQCAEALAPHVDFDLSDTVADPEGAWLEDVSRVQPILWATMVSLAEVWAAAGVRPAAVIGHSQGEIAAACVIGALSLADGARLVATRSRLLTRLSGRGGMLALGANREEALRRLIPGVQLAAENGAGSVVLAGAADALRRYADTAEADGIRTRMIPVDYASHSEQVDEIATALTAATGDIVARDAPDSEFYSTVAGRTGEPIATEALGGGYWFENLRNTVEFATAVRRAITDGYGLFIEVSPHPLLLTAIGETADTLGGADDVAVVGTLARDRGGLDQIWYSLGQVHAAGGAVDWARALAAYAPRIVDLPTYRFSTRRYWLPDGRAALNRYAPNPIGSVDEWRYRVAYLPVAASTGSLPGTVTVITDHHRTGAADALRAAGAAVTTCRIGEWRTDAPAADASLVLLGGEAEPTAHGGAQSVPPALAEAFELVSRHIRGPAHPLWFAGDESAPDVAAAFALIRVAALEFPNHIGGTVDLPDGALDADRLLAALRGEHDQVSLRTPSAGEIGVRRLLAGPFPGSGPRTGDWTPRGTVLITGATGGIGGQLTRWLAARGAPRMILLSRRGEAAPGAADLADELAAAGAQPRIVAADASDTDALVRIRDEYAAAGTPITSVFHLAGGGTLADLIDTDAAEFAATAHAKIDGARALDAVFPDVEDFVLFSSISAVWGSGSHGAYASANAYLDALARGRRAAGRDAVSIVWGIWDPADGGGMAANLVREQLAARGIPFMDPSRSLRELGAVLGGDPQPVEVIAAVDWERFLPVFTSARSSGLFDELPRGGVPDAGESRSGGELPDLARRVLDLPDRERDAVVSDVVRDTIAAVLRLDPGEVDTERAFRDVGIDSLTAIDTRNRLRAATGIPLPVTMVFDHPTVTALARYITGRLLEGSEEPTAPSVDRTAPSPGRGTSVDLTTPADDLLDVDEMDIADLIRAANDAEEAAR